MKENLKLSGSLFFRLIIINVMCFITVCSINILATAFFSEEVGYTAIGTVTDEKGEEKSEFLYRHYYKDGEDTELAVYEAKGLEITKDPLKDISKTGKIVSATICQILCFALLGLFIYNTIWKIGLKDINLVKIKNQNEDKLKGFKVGLLAIVPALIFVVVLFVARGSDNPFFMAVYKICNYCFYGLNELICGSELKLSALPIWCFAALFATHFIIPLITHLSYIAGYKNLSISQKILFKKN